MKLADMQKKSKKDLEKHAEKLKKKLADLKREQYIKEIKDVSQFTSIRREIAQALTVAGQKSDDDSDKESK